MRELGQKVLSKTTSALHVDYFLLLRAFACIMVIRQHVDIHKLFKGDWIFIGNQNSGGQAVIAFFMLSGYLITKVLITKYKFDAKGLYEFYLGRFTRLVPLYYFVTLLTIFFIFPYIIQSDKYYPQILQLFTFTYPGGLPYWNQVYWTISIEALFYVVAPIIGFIYYKIYKSYWALIVPVAFLLLVQSQWSLLNVPDIITLFSANIGIFLLGGSLMVVVNALEKLKLKFAPQLSFILQPKYNSLIRVASVGLFYLSIAYPWLYAFPAISTSSFSWELFSAILVAAFIVIIEITGGSKEQIERDVLTMRLVGINLVNRLGQLSYAIFLVHMLVVFRVNDPIRVQISQNFNYGASAIITLIVSIVLSVLLAEFLYRSVEIPSHNWIIKHFKAKNQ